jgi:ribonuclease G
MVALSIVQPILMSEEVLINVTPREIRVAMVENGVLQEILIERSNKRGLVGNIYKGRVSRVLPGMCAAFVDIGLERTAFLHASDMIGNNNNNNNDCNNGHPLNISDILREGQTLLVQVIKDPLGSKGARLTTQISIPSRYLVLIPDLTTVGISQRIDGGERQRLIDIVRHHLAQLSVTDLTDNTTQAAAGGFIIRTAADGINESSLQADMKLLCRLWESTQEHAKQAHPASLVYEDLSLVFKTLRDLVGMNVEKIRVDSRETYHEMRNFSRRFIPELENLLEHYSGERPIFDLYAIEDEINRALERRVELKSGGYLVLDQTEAMTTVDVNTGKFVGHRNLEETIFKTNLEATQVIARQLRLRNLGGIIIIDFIDMEDLEHRRQVIRSLEKYLERDHAKIHISGISELGLVQMTRKRTRESLEHVLCETCPMCGGRGSVKSPETICYEVFREITREARQYDVQKFVVFAAAKIVDFIIEEESTSLAELERFIQRPIKFQIEPHYTQEQYDIVLM